VAPNFLTIDEALAIHQRAVVQFGGSAGVRDIGLLQSALAVPQSAFGGQYLHASLAEMAAAYLFHLASNHPFVDGNKRVAAVAARVFLLMNDAEFDPTEQEYGDLVLDVAAGRAGKDAAVAFFKKHVRPA
jgi:death-on-curing protein